MVTPALRALRLERRAPVFLHPNQVLLGTHDLRAWQVVTAHQKAQLEAELVRPHLTGRRTPAARQCPYGPISSGSLKCSRIGKSGRTRGILLPENRRRGSSSESSASTSMEKADDFGRSITTAERFGANDDQ